MEKQSTDNDRGPHEEVEEESPRDRLDRLK